MHINKNNRNWPIRGQKVETTSADSSSLWFYSGVNTDGDYFQKNRWGLVMLTAEC